MSSPSDQPIVIPRFKVQAPRQPETLSPELMAALFPPGGATSPSSGRTTNEISYLQPLENLTSEQLIQLLEERHVAKGRAEARARRQGHEKGRRAAEGARRLPRSRRTRPRPTAAGPTTRPGGPPSTGRRRRTRATTTTTSRRAGSGRSPSPRAAGSTTSTARAARRGGASPSAPPWTRSKVSRSRLLRLGRREFLMCFRGTRRRRRRRRRRPARAGRIWLRRPWAGGWHTRGGESF